MKKTIRNYGIAILLFASVIALAWAPPGLMACMSSTYYNNAAGPLTAYPIATGKNDTVAGAGTDTFKLQASLCGNVKSLTFSNDIWKSAGTPTVTVALYVSSNGGSSYASTPIYTYTAYPTTVYTATPTTTTYIVNPNFGGVPYTNYMWVATNSASSTMNWQGSVTPVLGGGN